MKTYWSADAVEKKLQPLLDQYKIWNDNSNVDRRITLRNIAVIKDFFFSLATEIWGPPPQ